MTESSKPPSGRRMKVAAPPPPQAPQPAPRHLFRNSPPDGGGTSAMDVKENILRPTVDFLLTLPRGYQVSVTEDGSKALMDLLVDLCGRHHLNPSLHTLELLSPEGHSLGFKPNALLGSFNVACVLIKEKVVEERASRRPAPKVPEKTVRLMVNFHGNQKAVVRVNPLVPLQALIPAVCDKCDFDPAHVLLLKDSISRKELPLDKSLTELGVKELYVHDQSLVLQPKMASAPALNNSDYIYSSTASLGRPQKKGLLNIFPFSKRKSKTDKKSLDMDDFDDIAIQNSDTKFYGLSTMSGVSYKEERPGSLEQSQSFTDIPTMHAKAESKKRRAPAPPAVPTPSQGNASIKNNQEGPGSEGQRKRKAPPPPPTPSPIGQDSDGASTTAVPISNPRSIEFPTPVPRTRTPQSPTFSDDSVVIQATKTSPGDTAPGPPPVHHATPSPSSPSPSSTTTDSLAVQDSSSELSRSLDDSDIDLDQAGSCCSTSSTASGSVPVQPIMKKSNTTATQQNKEVNSDSNSRSDTESALNLKLDEAENNRHSGMAWLHSRKSSSSVQKQETTAPEAETPSLDSSSVCSSLPDQGYTLSEGAPEGEDSGIVSSPSDTQMTSPEGSLSADGKTGDREEGIHIREASSVIDEENTTWGKKDRHNARYPHPESVNGFKDDSELTIQLHQTLADLEADLADHEVIISAKYSPYTKPTDSSDVPVSVVDMDVPVTAIDEVLEEFEFVLEHEVKLLTKTESIGKKGDGFSHHPDNEQQNKNNSASTAALSNKIGSARSKLSESKSSAPQETKSTGTKKEKKAQERKIKEKGIADTAVVKQDTQTLAVKSSADLQKTSRPPVITADLPQHNTQSLKQKKSELPAKIQRSVSPGRDEAIHKVNLISSSFSPLHSKITHNVPSRYGMKTFTVVPPKPSVTTVTKTEPADQGGSFAIKIDDQGNMVAAGIPHLKSRESPKSEIKKGTPVCENGKAIWSSNKRKEHLVTQRNGQVDQLKESSDALSGVSAVVLEGRLKTSSTEYQQTTSSAVSKPIVMVQTKVGLREDHKPLIKDMSPNREFTEVESKISLYNIQRPSNKPSLPLPLHSDRKQQLNFVKPSRRTSSHYVASALAKYTPKTPSKPSSVPKVTNSSDSLKTEKAAGFKKSVTQFQSPQGSLSDITENDSTVTVTAPCPKRSMSFPEYISESQRDSAQVKISRGRFENNAVAKKEGLDTADKETAKKNHSQYNESPQIQVTSNCGGDYTKHIQPQSPSPAINSAPHSSFKPPIAPKTKPQDQIHGVKEALKEVKLQSSTIASDSGETSGSVPEVTVFGPVKKFKPVICRSVEKETSLHSSLMEAIQTSGGKERLRKISTNANNEKKMGCVEEGNERSALLAGLRSQNINRLKKTKSKASSEVERFREESSKGEKTVELSLSSLTRSSPGFPPLPPPPPMSAPPPPPPPVFLQGKPNPVGHLNANAPLNPALAREALLEAIRSGSGAEKLRKVSAPKKTVQVNGRLGTIHTTSSTIFQH